MVDPATNSILLLYDDAQSIYKKKKGLGFSLSSVGIEAAGRTTILKINYRNTKEILNFAYKFARNFLSANAEESIPLVEPEAVGNSGPEPTIKECRGMTEEIEYSISCLKRWREQGLSWRDMAVLYVDGRQGGEISRRLLEIKVPNLLMSTKANKQSYNSENDQVTILSIHSSKGLEFPAVIIVGTGQLIIDEENREKTAKLLYVGMTRSQKYLSIAVSGKNEFKDLLIKNAGA